MSANLTGLKPGTVYHYRLNAVNAGGLSTMVAASTFPTTAITPPVATVSNPVLGVGTEAHFSGTINPEKGPADPALYDVTWRFECTPKCLDAEDKVLTGPGIPADNSVHPVSVDVVLEPNTEYQVRLVASNAGETATAGPVFVSTPALPAIAQTLGVSVTDDSAMLGAKINPLNSPVSYQFEWGLTTAYEHDAPLAPEPALPCRQRLPLRRCPAHRSRSGNHLPLSGRRDQHPAQSADRRGGQDLHDPRRSHVARGVPQPDLPRSGSPPASRIAAPTNSSPPASMAPRLRPGWPA